MGSQGFHPACFQQGQRTTAFGTQRAGIQQSWGSRAGSTLCQWHPQSWDIPGLPQSWDIPGTSPIPGTSLGSPNPWTVTRAPEHVESQPHSQGKLRNFAEGHSWGTTAGNTGLSRFAKINATLSIPYPSPFPIPQHFQPSAFHVPHPSQPSLFHVPPSSLLIHPYNIENIQNSQT